MNKNIEIREIMLTLDNIPIVTNESIFKDALDEMNKYKLGITCITNKNLDLIGIITDGDIRRRLLKSQKPISALFIENAIKYCIKNPQTVFPEMKLIDAVKLMESKQIWDLPVTDKQNKLIGLFHLHSAISKIFF